MLPIRIITAAASIIAVLTFALVPASAAPCEGNGACAAANPGSPLRLNQFMKNKRPAKTVQNSPKKPTAARAMPAAISEDRQVEDPAEAPDAVAEVFEPESGPVRTIETNGVTVTSSDELNEIDTLAGDVKLVGAEELNEIDLASNIMPIGPMQQTTALDSMASDGAPTVDRSWIGKVLAAFGGILAVAGAARLLIA
jgi:hypothetical protein